MISLATKTSNTGKWTRTQSNKKSWDNLIIQKGVNCHCTRSIISRIHGCPELSPPLHKNGEKTKEQMKKQGKT
jgi:hypothetical protein